MCVCVCPPSELFYTERAHLRTLKVMDGIFYQRLSRDGILPPEDIKHIFTNLEEIIQLHGDHTYAHTHTHTHTHTNCCPAGLREMSSNHQQQI